MALKFGDRAKETSTTTGTGTLNLGGAVSGLYTTFVASVGTGAVVSYAIEHQSADEWEVGVGTVTDATPDTLSRTKILASSNAGAAVNLSAGTKHVWIDCPAELVREAPDICCGRLTLESGVAISTTDQTAKGTLYWTPYKGNKVSLFNGSSWKTHTFTELSISVPSEVYRIYDVFVYDNSGTLTLELNAWDSGGQTTGTITGGTNATPIVITDVAHGRSVGNLVGINGMVTLRAPNGKIWYISVVGSADIFTLEGSVGNGVYASGGTWYLIPTARTDALVLQDGVYCKTGALTRRYLGTFMTGSTSAQTEDSTSWRLVWNMYNRVPRTLLGTATGNHTYTLATWRQWNALTTKGAQQVWLVRGLDEDPVLAETATLNNNASVQKSSIGIGINRCAANSAQDYGGWGQSINTLQVARYAGLPGIGFKFFQKLEYSVASGTCTWYDDDTTYQKAFQLEALM